jgi:CelD/BcsL family acetyltransferase involved in cellulose biosynthesis
MSETIKIVLITTSEALEELRSDWGNLHAQCAPQDVFLSWEWLSAWWSSYHAGKDLWLVTARDEAEQLTGLAPLMLIRQRENGIPLRILRTLGNPNSDVGGFLVRDGDAQTLSALCDFIVQQKAEWDALELNEFQSDLPATRAIVEHFRGAGLNVQTKTGPHYYLPTEGGWDDFFKQLSPKLRQNLRRRQRRAEETGTVLYTRAKGSEVTWEHFLTIFEINKTGNFPDLYRSEKDQQFHRAILERMQGRDWIEIHIFSLNGEALAYQYGFEINGRYEDWRRGFSESYPQLSSGKMLMGLSLEHQFKSGYREVDFLRGAHEYKADWKPVAREYLKINVIQSHDLKAWLAFTLIPRLKNWIKTIIRSRNPETT